jgi:hypothetical protein
MKTFGCNLSADAFARFFELVTMLDVIKVDDGQFYEAQHACCTFNTWRQNTRKGITRIQIAPCCKTNLTDDWNSYWFYVKVNMSEVPGYEGPAYPLSCSIAPLTSVFAATNSSIMSRPSQRDRVFQCQFGDSRSTFPEVRY